MCKQQQNQCDRRRLNQGILSDANRIRENNINPVTENAQPKMLFVEIYQYEEQP